MPFISLELDVRVAFASFRTKSYHSDTEQPFKETKLKFQETLCLSPFFIGLSAFFYVALLFILHLLVSLFLSLYSKN